MGCSAIRWMDEWMEGYKHCLFAVVLIASVILCSLLLAMKIKESLKEEMLIKYSGVCWNERNWLY